MFEVEDEVVFEVEDEVVQGDVVEVEDVAEVENNCNLMVMMT